MENFLVNFLRGLRNLIYPAVCLGCSKRLNPDEENNFLCRNCWQALKRNVPPFCTRCGRTIEQKNKDFNICKLCQNRSVYFDKAYAPFRYEGAIQKLIHSFKYKGNDYIGKVLADNIIEFILEYHLPVSEIDVVMPVPLYSSRKREREFNQAEVLAQLIAKRFNKTLVSNNLIRTRYTSTQTELEYAQRLENVKGCFNLKRPQEVANKNVLLIDDVLTTAATVSEAASVLKEANARYIVVVTIAN
ncbi:MAG: ComF family protein [Candidatus Omnitrophica bacterium]|nr:ComF family protein [Candidatus Omnitrophota bacterium]